MPSRRHVALGAAATAALVLWSSRRPKASDDEPADVSAVAVAAAQSQSGEQKRRVGVNKDFARRLWRLLSPRLTGPVLKLLALHSSFLVTRTLLSLHIAHLDGAIVGHIVQRRMRPFLVLLGRWVGVGVVAAVVNSLIRFLENKLALALRTGFTKTAIDKYMADDVYYRVSAMDSRMTNADQCLTEDVRQFSDLLAHLYSHLSKPILDICLVSYQLIRRSKAKGSGVGQPTLFAVGAVSGIVSLLRWCSPPFGRLVKRQAELAGAYRFVHSRLITNAEEVAFYQGHEVERGVLWRAYEALVKHTNTVYKKRVGYSATEGFLLKYVFSASGYLLVSYPLFFARDAATQSAGERTQDYITGRGLLLNAADAIERVLSAYKEVTELAGYTYRVSDMLETFEDVAAGRFVKQQAQASDSFGANDRGSVTTNERLVDFRRVPIVSPNGDVLVRELSFRVEHGQHLLITGPNGCGKSSLFRILGGLWPVFAGELQKPGRSAVLYVPQRPYLRLGTLREQVTYPADPADAGASDAELRAIMDAAHLGHIVDRHGWDAEENWMDVLSGGEKQRVAVARVLLKRPAYAILDEATSAVSIDVEDKLYNRCKQLGISLLTVSHRPSLWKHHDWILCFDGEGGYEFKEMDSNQLLSLNDEKESLEKQLADLPRMQARLEELRGMLGSRSGETGSA